MATNRFSYSDDFTLKDNKVGINSSTPSEKLDVDGSIGATNFEPSGISTFSTYESYLTSDQTIKGNRIVNTSTVSSSISSKISIGIGDTLSVSQGTTIGQGNIQSLKVTNTFTPPCGGTIDRPTAPKPGALFYNKDFRTIEYWDGNFWRQVDNVAGGGRGLQIGGYKPGVVHTYVQTFNIATGGEATFFGTPAMANPYETAGFGSRTRAFNATDGSYTQQIDYYTVATQSNGIDFGNLTVTGGYGSALSSQTRGLIGVGYIHPSPGANSKVIDYVEMATTGNAIEFGNNTRIGNSRAGLSDGIRGVWAGNGGSPDPSSTVDLNIISSKGSAVDYGDTSYKYNSVGASNNVRGILTNLDGLESYNLSSGGNAVEFGDRPTNMTQSNCTASHTRVVIAGGRDNGSPSQTFTDALEYVNIASTGSSINFGNLSEVTASGAGYSDSHGGLGGY